jgi:CRISPR-associated exonuclease Cas4
MTTLSALLALLGLAAMIAGFWWWRRVSVRWHDLGLPRGRVVASDTGNWRRCDRPLYAARYRLAGRPDYLVRTGSGLVPVEVKTGRRGAQPYASDLLQLGAYLLLVEESTGRRPPYGLLCYGEHHFEVPYTLAFRASVVACLEEMRRLRSAQTVAPEHREWQRCERCGQRVHCETVKPHASSH